MFKLTLAPVLLILVSLCGSSVPPGDVLITATDNQFDKTDIAITSGTVVTIRVTNGGVAIHSFHVGWNGKYSSEFCDPSGPDPCLDGLAGGQVGTLTFIAPGVGTKLPFRCDFHPSEMTGTISLQSP